MIVVDTVNVESQSIDDIYKNISSYLFDNQIVENEASIYDELIEREKIGSIKIYEDMYLPHLVSNNILIDSVIRVRGNCSKVLFILLGEHSDRTKGVKIVNELLEREFVDNLFSCSNDKFRDIILKI